LKNPAYSGQAAFGKKKTSKKIPSVRPKKGASEYPKQDYSVCKTKKEDWIYIPVPAIIDNDLYDAVQVQLEENQKIARASLKGVIFYYKDWLFVSNVVTDIMQSVQAVRQEEVKFMIMFITVAQVQTLTVLLVKNYVVIPNFVWKCLILLYGMRYKIY
jgi:hypothetical protein